MKKVGKQIQDGVARAMFGKEKVTSVQNFYDLVDKNMAGEQVSMSSFKGEVLLLVNVASKWGLTKQNYTEFSQIADEYSDRGLKILAFPCNQFGGQEPVSIKTRFSVSRRQSLTFSIFYFAHSSSKI